MNLKKALPVFCFVLMIALAFPLRAQTGCDDSPEDPTIVLALVAGVGVLVVRARAMHNRAKVPTEFEPRSKSSK